MATVLEDCNTEEQHSVVRFLWERRVTAKDIHKEIFPVYSGKCLSSKAVHIWIKKRGKIFVDDEEVETEV
jgi:tRNA(Ser,Leu) C12 N-acetylase TAN1